MKIRVDGAGVPPVRLYIPTALLLNSAVASLVSFAAVQKGVFLTTKQVMEFFRVVKSEINKHPQWVPVEVQTHNGVYVRIQL